MEQTKLMNLLREAAKPDCTKKRRKEIKVTLTKACQTITNNELAEDRGRKSTIIMTVTHLYTMTLKECPEHLPMLFPLFSLLCGNRDPNTYICDKIDWDQLPDSKLS